MLRQKIQHEIRSSLTRSSFTEDDFDIDFSPLSTSYNGAKQVALITFKHEQGYFFLIKENIKYRTEKINSTTTGGRDLALVAGRLESKTVETREEKELESKYDCIVSPGHEQAEETWSIISLCNIQQEIRSWLNSLKEELAFSGDFSTGDHDKKQSVKDVLAIHLKAYIDDKDGRFNESEVNDISKKMMELFEAIQKNQSLLNDELKELKSIVTSINENLSLYKKGTWYETTLNRLSQWSSGVSSVEKLINALAKIGELVT